MSQPLTITWFHLRQLNPGTGVAVTMTSDDRYAGKIVRVERERGDRLVLQRVGGRGVQTIDRNLVANIELMDWEQEMFAFEGE